MTKDLKFIKGFSKISVSKVCRKLNICRENVLNGTTSKDNITKVKEELESEIAKLYIKEDSTNEQ